MADHRFVRTKIWSDDWFSRLSYESRLLYLYLLSNNSTHICGYYELTQREMAFFTGLQPKKISVSLKELEPNIMYIDGWVAIKNYAKHQNVGNNEKIKTLIDRELKNVPEHVLSLSQKSKSKSEPIDRLSIAYQDTAQNIGGEDKSVDKDEDKVKKKYGELKNVLLSDEEKEKLKERYGVTEIKTLVDELSLYIPNKAGKPYKDHYATLLSWARKKGLQVKTEGKPPKMIPETLPNGSVRLIPNPNYHD